ncbi:outer membrane protein OmpK [Photobacterium sagamiensis]|uniref:nucleoside-specific channel-forming Tsx family protein n=1 Tax=Photobacterium sagamiensis TaxID=2910241 RepID=UPI003D0C954E
MNKSLFALIAFSTCVTSGAHAADYSDGIHKNDYQWKQFNLWHVIDQKPHGPDGFTDTFLELEFGGRSGFLDLYGYVDIFDITNSSSSDRHDSSNVFIKLAPRLSLDAMTGKDLSFGPVQELYIANLNNVSDPFFDTLIGLGADVQVPWFGKVGMNLYARHSLNNEFFKEEEGKWNGYQFSMNWFKPFYFFDNDSYISYQGYMDWLFDVDTYGNEFIAEQGGVMSNGIFWHSERYALGYSLDYVKDGYMTKDSKELESTGFTHYFSASYKF